MDLALHLSLNDLHLADGSGMACSSHSSGWSSMAYLVGAYCCLHGSWRHESTKPGGCTCDQLVAQGTETHWVNSRLDSWKSKLFQGGIFQHLTRWLGPKDHLKAHALSKRKNVITLGIQLLLTEHCRSSIMVANQTSD
ncbi:uncharacterized protein YALI1_E37295g [Yarrowia lipolytica]|uniref:Uncharacterized protein n=1 Tax=Yarrowia lipolytica TaxID=4952 RepID=A0A1D8NKS2_YARLL|nr:hypothetical protein YALI1_E37295g [Yarrowia lipolytica]